MDDDGCGTNEVVPTSVLCSLPSHVKSVGIVAVKAVLLEMLDADEWCHNGVTSGLSMPCRFMPFEGSKSLSSVLRS